MRGYCDNGDVINCFSLAVTKNVRTRTLLPEGLTSSYHFLCNALPILFRSTQSKLCINKEGTYPELGISIGSR